MYKTLRLICDDGTYRYGVLAPGHPIPHGAIVMSEHRSHDAASDAGYDLYDSDRMLEEICNRGFK